MNFRRKESHQKSNISSDTENTFLEERCKSCTPFIIVTSLVSFVVVVVGFIVYAQFFNPAGLFRAKAQIQGISTTAENTKEYIATLPPVSFAKSQKQNRGVLMFRGNPSRSSYGIDLFFIKGFDVLWKYPEQPMCSLSSAGGESKTWCGTGWTGQPAVWERDNGNTEIIFGAYDESVHFVNSDSGDDIRPAFKTGDIIKGSVTVDPDGYPLVYTGSRDNYFRILSVDKNNTAAELWKLWAYDDKIIWNDDWDGNPLIVDGILYQSGENGWFYAIELNRGYDENGYVTVNPQVLVRTPLFDDAWIDRVGDTTLSIESSPAYHDGRVYVANSGGRVVGFDVANITDGIAPIVFDFWAGDDTDATIVVDEDGMLYVASELERKTKRSDELGQIMKLNPYSDEPFVWGVPVPARRAKDNGGVWATPALGDGVLYVATHPGELLTIDTKTGDVLNRAEIGWHAWASPVIAGDTLIVGICTPTGGVRGYDISKPKKPTQKWEWQTPSGSCVESTPVVWNHNIYVGSRDGFVYKIGGQIEE